MRNAARALIVLAAVALVAMPTTPVAAHESRQVGDYEFVVGGTTSRPSPTRRTGLR